MNLLFSALTIVGGVIAASSLIIARKPDAQRFFDKATPYYGVFGVTLLAMGIWWALRVLPNVGGLFATSPFVGAITVGAISANILIGFLLGFSLVMRLLSKHDDAAEKGRQALVKIANVQAPLGFAAIVLGVLVMV